MDYDRLATICLEGSDLEFGSQVRRRTRLCGGLAAFTARPVDEARISLLIEHFRWAFAPARRIDREVAADFDLLAAACLELDLDPHMIDLAWDAAARWARGQGWPLGRYHQTIEQARRSVRATADLLHSFAPASPQAPRVCAHRGSEGTQDLGRLLQPPASGDYLWLDGRPYEVQRRDFRTDNSITLRLVESE